MNRKAFWISITVAVWLATSYVGWIGYVGVADDLVYTQYAHQFDHPPRTHWEFRIPAVVAIRACYLAFGLREFAACLPTLIASLMTAASVAWFIDWPRRLDWKSQSAMLLICTSPLDTAFRSVPGAPMMSAGLLSVGSVCMLKGSRWQQYAGAAIFALAFMTHEISFFYIAIFCIASLAIDWRRFWRPVVVTIAISGTLVLIECAAYQMLLGEPLARYETAAAESAGPYTYKRFDGSAILFYLWPLGILFLSKQWVFGLVALFLSGLVGWRRLNADQKILLATMIALWFWLGYGTIVPWAYRPRSRAFHYYIPFAFGIAALLPYTLEYLFAGRRRIAFGLAATLILIQSVFVAGSGNWGQNIDVSRDLLAYAKSHSDELFLIDSHSFNEFRQLGGFEDPENVVCLDQQLIDQISVDAEGLSNEALTKILGRPIDGVLENRERIEHRYEREFRQFLDRHCGRRDEISPVRYRVIFAPVLSFAEPHDFMVRSLGGAVARIK